MGPAASSEAATVRSNTYGETSPSPVSVHDATPQYTMMKMASASDESRGRVAASIRSAMKIAAQSASPRSPSSRNVAYQLWSIGKPLNDLFVNPCPKIVSNSDRGVLTSASQTFWRPLKLPICSLDSPRANQLDTTGDKTVPSRRAVM